MARSVVLKLFGSSLTIFTVACATMPQNPNEAVQFGKTSSWVVKREFKVKGIDLKQAEDRLAKFSNKCLNRETVYTERGSYGGTITRKGIFTPKIAKQNNSVILTLQRKQTGVHMGGNPPPEGHFQALVEAKPSKGGLQVFAWRAKEGMLGGVGNMLEDVESWLTAKGEFCPSLH